MTRTTPRPVRRRPPQGCAVHPWADVVLPEPEHDAGVMAAAGQLWATLADLGRFAAFLLGDTGDVLGPGDARGDGRARRRRLLGAGLVGLRAGPAGAARRRADAGRARRLDARLPRRGLRRPRGADRRGVAGQRDQRAGAGGLRAAGRPAGRRAADRRGVAALAVAGAAGRRSASGSGGRRRTCCAPSPAGCCTWGRCRAGRAGQPVRAARRRHAGSGLDGYYAGETLRIADGPPGRRHVRLHPHAVRPRGAGARRRGRARLARGRGRPSSSRAP